MMGTMIDYDLNPYSPAKYPVPCKKRKNPAKTKSAKTKSAKTKSAKKEGESQRKMTDWLISSSRNERKVTFFEKIEVCEFYKNGTLKKKRIHESLVDSVEGRNSPFDLKRHRQKLRRQQKYLNRKNLYPNKEKYIHVRKTLERVNSLLHFCDFKFQKNTYLLTMLIRMTY